MGRTLLAADGRGGGLALWVDPETDGATKLVVGTTSLQHGEVIQGQSNKDAAVFDRCRGKRCKTFGGRSGPAAIRQCVSEAAIETRRGVAVTRGLPFKRSSRVDFRDPAPRTFPRAFTELYRGSPRMTSRVRRPIVYCHRACRYPCRPGSSSSSSGARA